MLTEIYIATGNSGQAMIVLAQTLAQLEEFPNQFAHISVEMDMLAA